MQLSGSLTWGSPGWLVPVAIFSGVIGLTVVFWYLRRGIGWPIRTLAAISKLVAIGALTLCVVEPLFNGVRPRPGANLFLVAADNSQSLSVTDRPGRPSRGDELRKTLRDDAPWLTRLGQDFELRRYLIDSRLRATDSFRALSFDGRSSALRAALATIGGQFRARPVGGVLLLTDGNATDWDEAAIDWDALPPLYPVILGRERELSDVAVPRVTVTQTNFETTPVTISAEISAVGLRDESVVVQLLDPAGKEVQRHVAVMPSSGLLVHRFQFRPEQPGLSFFRVRAFAARDEAAVTAEQSKVEATLANNTRLVLVDRGRGPYRVLYLSGRPNWEFKFLRRAVAEDDEVELVGLLRIAKREPKFSFRGRVGETTNPLFRGFGNQGDATAEQYDEPVLVRFGTRDPAELLDGFPKTAEQLFAYHAVMLDDVEAEFFTRDQMALLHQFVSQRGGALLMLGGQESFAAGGYARTPLGELLPVYIDKSQPALPPGDYRWSIAREGWLQHWVRLRATETEEEQRLAQMPTFRTINGTTGLKPGASVLVSFVPATQSEGSMPRPGLVVQPFGKGRAAALLVGDLWRWGLRRPTPTNQDLEQSWRQTVRWLVADVPGRVEAQIKRGSIESAAAISLTTQVRDAAAQPLDNADVKVTVGTPDGKQVAIDSAASDSAAGEYVASFVPRVAGAYQARITVKAPDGSDIGTTEAGFVHEPESDEFRALVPNRDLLKRIAERTGGEVIEPDQLDQFVTSLPNRRIPITEPWVYPLWHRWPMLILALSCLIGEWGLRRWKGWP